MSKDIAKSGNSPRDWFGQSLVKLANELDFLAVDCDVAGGTGLHHFRNNYPDRFIQCGISEQAAAGIACGLATRQPVIFSTFATFGARAWEVLRLQAYYNNLPVITVLSHCGIDVGPDGVSAQSLEHYGLWRLLPGPVLHPCCPKEMYEALKWLVSENKPGVVLTGRSSVELGKWADKVAFKPYSVECVSKVDNPSIALFSTGHTLARCVKAAMGSKIDVYQVCNLNDRPDVEFNFIADSVERFVIVEDHGSVGGLYDYIKHHLSVDIDITRLCVEDWGQSGESNELAKYYHIDEDGIRQCLQSEIKL